MSTNIFDKKELENKNWIMGFLIADGCLSWWTDKRRPHLEYARARFSQTDPQVLHVINKLLALYGIIMAPKNLYKHPTNNGYTLTLAMEETVKLCQWLPEMPMTRKEKIRREIIRCKGKKYRNSEDSPMPNR